jgi:aarF domain-containing kinase
MKTNHSVSTAAVPDADNTMLVPQKKNKNDRSIRGRDPSLIDKLTRRFTVFRVAFSVFLDYKWAQFQANREKRRLGLDLDDSDSDDHPEIEAYWSQVHARTADRLLTCIKRLEGFWVKVGQYLSTRYDIMPTEYTSRLGVLQDSMPPHPWDETYQTIREELGDDKLEHFERIDPQPLSTASLAQVHRATLKATTDNQTSRDVVLKVQHRGVAQLMLQDMENLRVILNLLAKTDPDLDFSPVIREYNQEVRKELDFRIEATNMKEVSELLKKADIKVIVPETIPDMVTERVLVMEFCEGFPVRDTVMLEENFVDRELLLERICASWAIQMHVGGVFNADPHMGNILVSTAVPDDSSVPVLLDFGLTKRLDPTIKLAFARLMHASHETDLDGLLQSFEEMGLKMNRHDPFEDMANMQRGFGNTTPQSQAKEVSKQKQQDYQRRMDAKRLEAGLEKGQKLRSPVEAWPSELVFFGRVTNMLRGLCSQMDVSYPYLRTMALAARQTLRESVPLDEHAECLIHPSSHQINTKLQQRLVDQIRDTEREGHMIGLQVCVVKHGKEVANVAAGTLGTSNPRPVTPSTLFNIFSVSKGILAIGLLRLVQDGRIESVDDPVSKYWPAFASKPKITVRHLLSHQAGLANTYPEDATLDTLLDWATMTKFMAEKAEPSHEPGHETQYHALTFAWLVGGLIEAVTGEPYDEFLDKILPHTDRRFPEEGVRRDIFLGGISEHVDREKDLAILSVEKDASQAETPTPLPKVEQQKHPSDEELDKDQKKKEAKKVLDKYRGMQQLMNPSVFNMRKVREAKLPSANGHASAQSLARVFDAVIRGCEENGHRTEPLLSKSMLKLARTSTRPIIKRNDEAEAIGQSKEAMLNDAQANFGLGFQLHEFKLANGDRAMSIGHAGLGGSVVIAVPEEETVVAFTLNHLSMESVARKRILGVVFEELGWEAPPSIPVEKAEIKL